MASAGGHLRPPFAAPKCPSVARPTRSHPPRRLALEPRCLKVPPVHPSRPRQAFRRLLNVADRLKFRSHRITHLLDRQGRHTLQLPASFPFALNLFRFCSGSVTRRLTWHERLELLLTLDGPLRERMGDLVVDLMPGDLLVVDHQKPHQVVDRPGLNTRVLVISFLPECVFAPGCPPADSAFLLPFFRKVEGRPQLLRAHSPRAAEAHDALARLLSCYCEGPAVHREAACKAWLLVLLEVLIREFRDSALERTELLRRQQQAHRLSPLFNHVRTHYADRIALADAATLCGMSRAVFGRVFKQISGMTLRRYLNQVRMSHAVDLLEQSDSAIAEIAARLGYSDQSHFDRRFRQTFGRTPSQHRTGLHGDV
jgi:AraC-like DNA-binding protein